MTNLAKTTTASKAHQRAGMMRKRERQTTMMAGRIASHETEAAQWAMSETQSEMVDAFMAWGLC